MNLKKPTTVTQQVSLLQKKGITIADRQACESFLYRVNYYRLSGYLLPFVKHRKSGQSLPSFDQIQNVYEFDKELREIVFRATQEIEIYLRTQFAQYHTRLYGEDGYMNSSSYNLFHDHNAFSKRIATCIYENRKSSVVRHHNAKYNGRFPLWVIIDFFSMGMLSYFYRGMKNQDKAYLAQTLYGINYQTMLSWLRCITDLRNRCAHYARLYYWIFPATPKMPSGIKYVPTRRLFAQLYMLKMMYPDPTAWNRDILRPLVRLIKKYRSYISLDHLDFPYYWKSMLTNK